MQHFDLNSALLAVLGFIIRWLFHLNAARHKVVIKRGDKFDWGFYFEDNSITMVLSAFCTMALLLLVPMGLTYFNVIQFWGPLVAFGCGTSNIEITEMFKSKFLDKVKERTGIDDKNNKQS